MNKVYFYKKNLFLSIISTLFFVNINLSAENELEKITPKDTIHSHLLDEIVISSSTKETNDLRTLPGAVSFITPQMIDGQKIISIKNLSMIIPNFYLFDYGSRLSTPVYIRGIGERSTGQSIGMYVDNMPYLDKSLFDFDLLDIQRIEVLRGPQGTLYGRNAMSGIINIFTNSSFNEQTKVSLTGGNHGLFRAKGVIARPVSENVALSLSGYYDGNNGYFNNDFNDKKADKLSSAGGRVRLDWKINSQWNVQWMANYDYSDQGAFPYGEYNDGKIANPNHNYIGSYDRESVGSNLNIQYANEQFILNSTTGFIYFDDDMKMDIDYSPKDIFSINQKQNERLWTEELTIKSNASSNYQWSFGAFGFHNDLKTDVLTTMGEQGVEEYIVGNVSQYLPPIMTFSVEDTNIPMPGLFKTPAYGGALFHQSTYNNLFIDGLSITAGVRLDYEKTKLDYNTSAAMTMNLKTPGPTPPFVIPTDTSLIGDHSSSFTEILPKIALKYEINSKNYVYASVSKGYKTGGYNIQNFADIARNALMQEAMGDLLGMMPPNMTKPNINFPTTPIDSMVLYKPEYSWNYEIGFKGELIKDRLFGEIAAFYLDVNDIQITDFVDSGQGRILKNAGKAKSMGVDLSLTAVLTDEFRTILNYGYTHATLDNYKFTNENGEEVDCSGNYIPFSPRNTFSINAIYNKRFRDKWIDGLNIQAQYNGAGKIYWTEENDVTQNFYGLLNLKAGINKGIWNLSFWTQNTLDTDYTAFYFETTMYNLGQRGKPFTCGVDLSVSF